MSTDEYVPSDEELLDGYRRKKVTLYGWTYQPVLSRAEIRRGLARVRRDAAREALDGLAIDLAVTSGYTEAEEVRDYRDAHYPEETP